MTYSLGIDIGTTFTAAAVQRAGVASIVQLGVNRAAVPSVVVFRGDDTVLTGDAAERRSRTEPDRVAREFKRRFGDQTPMFIGGSPRSPEMITSRLLRDVVDTVAEREGGPPNDGLAITHPAAWGEYKLGVLEQAIRIAGLTDVTMLAEPIAAAVHYASLERVPDGSILGVYDLGGGTFDAAVVVKRGELFEILGQPEGIERLGGVDFDSAVLEHVRRQLGGDLDELDPTGTEALRLRQECITAKEALSTDSDVSISVLIKGEEHTTRLTRAEFEDAIRPLLTTSVEAMSRALGSASVAPDQLHSLLLVGGGSRIPLVAEMLINEFGRPVAVDTHPKHSIALGAARFVAAETSGRAVPPVAAVTEPTPPTVAAPIAAATIAAPVAAAPGGDRSPSAPKRRPRSVVAWWAAAAVVVAIAAAVGFAVINSNGDGVGEAESTVADTVTTTATVPPTTATTVAPPTTSLTVVPPVGDLGLAVPITEPPCDEQAITILFSAIDPARYVEDVSAKLAEFPGSNYLRTASTCPSLRPDINGNDIYIVYFGPFDTDQAACDARLNGPSDAYVKPLSLVQPVSYEIPCP